MRFRPLVALLAGIAVPVLEVEAEQGPAAARARGLETADHDDHCPHDNLLRCLIGTPTLAYTFCSWSVGIYPTPVTIYETVTAPAATTTTKAAATSTSSSTSQPASPSSQSTSISSATTSTSSPATVTVTQTTTDTVTLDHTQTTTDTVIETVVSVVVTTIANSTVASLPAAAPNNATSTAATKTSTSAPAPVRFLRAARTTPKTSLACLGDLQPAVDSVTSACSCFASSQPTPTTTSTVTWVEGAPFCPGRDQGPEQPTFPNCFADFHPYNCGTDHVGQIACSCALTSEGTAQCTLGDYERDNACTTSDDCAEGWYCTVIECFGDGVPSVCTKGCPTATPTIPLNQLHLSRNLSIVIINNNGNEFGSGRAGNIPHEKHQPSA